MAGYPPGVPPVPPLGYDPRDQRRFYRDQARAQRAAFRAQEQQMRYQMRSLRRGSVLGPILLIAIGALFLLLQTGRIDHQRFWGWYSHWWPLLLVAAGIVVLAEWTLDQFHMRDPQRPPYRRSIGGGLVMLLLILCIAGPVIGGIHGDGRDFFGRSFVWNMDNVDQFLGDKHESDQTVDLAFTEGGSLAVVNPRGDVTVNGTSDDDRIHIAIHKQIYSRSDSDADSKAQQLNPGISTVGSAMSITMASLDGARGDLVIAVPASAVVAITANRGDIHVGSIKAPVTVTANHGDIELSAITGQASAHINSGGTSLSAHSIDGGISIQGHADDLTLANITGLVSISGEFFGTTHLEHINGAIHFHTSRADFQLARLDGQAEIIRDNDISADQALGPLVLTTHNGNVTLDRIAGDVSVTNRNGTIDLTAAPLIGNITLEDRNGSIKATLPEHAGFTVQASTNSGSIDTDLQLSQWGTGNGKNLSGTVGAGGPLVHIATTNGDISLHKGDVQPLAAMPPAPPRITLVPPEPPAVPHVPKRKTAAE